MKHLSPKVMATPVELVDCFYLFSINVEQKYFAGIRSFLFDINVLFYLSFLGSNVFLWTVARS